MRACAGLFYRKYPALQLKEKQLEKSYEPDDAGEPDVKMSVDVENGEIVLRRSGFLLIVR